MVYKIYLGIIGVLMLNSVQGIKHVDCGLWVQNAKIEMRCSCDDGEVPFGWLCRPADASCPNGYFDIFENRCKCVRYVDEDDSNSECEDLCDDECENGICLASGKCSCKAGYSMSKANKCEPVCADGCKNGVCVGPNKCQCFEGYFLTISNKCQPICEYECENGYCMYPNWCSCNTGYKRVGPNKCDPVCSDDGCGIGSCVAPGECECHRGYSKDDDGKCSICGRECEDYEF